MWRVVRVRRYDAEIARLAVPALGALAVDPIVSLVDTAFVGRLGATALAAVALAGAVFAVSFALFNFLEYGVTPYVAGALGAGDPEAADRFAIGALGVGAGAGIVVAIGLIVAAVPVLHVLGAGRDVLEPAVAYLRIRATALPAVMIAMVGHGTFRGHRDTATPMIVTAAFNLVNLVLDPLLIFGAGLGVAGAAIATAVAQWIGGVWFLVLLLRRGGRGLGIRLEWPGRAAFAPLWGAGRALVLRTGALLAMFTAATAVAARVGTIAVAAHQIAVQLWFFLALALDALAIAAQAMVADALGGARRDEAREVADRLLLLGGAAGIVVAVALVSVAPWVGRWFTSDVAVLAAFGAVYPFVILMQPINGLVFVWDGIAIGAGAFGFLAGSTVAATLGAGIILGAVLPLGWGLAGVWWALAAMMVLRALTLAWWHRHGALAA